MASYPDLTQVVNSTENPDDGTQLARAESGKPRLQTYYSRTWRTFRVVHDLSDADKQVLMDFYVQHKYDVNAFTWHGDGQTYSVRFAGHPEPIPIAGDRRWRVQVTLVEVA